MNLATTSKEISAVPAAFFVAISTIIIIIIIIIIISERMVVTFNRPGMDDKFYFVNQTTEGLKCWSYDTYMAERKNIYTIIVDKHEGKDHSKI